jgi:hypothetical protein
MVMPPWFGSLRETARMFTKPTIWKEILNTPTLFVATDEREVVTIEIVRPKPPDDDSEQLDWNAWNDDGVPVGRRQEAA